MSEKIRVLHAVSQMDRGGIENFLMELYRNIDRSKIQFDFLDHSSELGAFDKEILDLGGRIFKLNKLSSKYFLQYPKDLRKFFSEHSEYKIIHAHLNLLSSFTLKVAMESGVETRIAHSHSSFFLNKGLKRLVKNYAKTQINKYTTDRFACSKDAGIWQFGINQWNQANVKLIKNAIDINKFKFSAEHRKKIRGDLNLKDTDILFAHSGKFRKVKNHSFLIDVFSKIKQREKNAKLILIGAGELKENIERQIKALGINDSVFFTGDKRIANVNEFLSAADCFIFPSLYEGLGISLIEAQVSGLPCFASDSIPLESKISEKIEFISLKNDAAFWAKLILENLNMEDFEDRSLPNLAHSFDIKKIAKELEAFYISATIDDKILLS